MEFMEFMEFNLTIYYSYMFLQFATQGGLG